MDGVVVLGSSLLQSVGTRIWSRAPRSLLYAGILRRRPATVPRAVRQLLEAKLLGRKVLRGAELAITYACQGHCSKCSCLTLRRPARTELTAEEIVTLGRRLVQGGALLLNFTGGEPLLREDVEGILRALRPQPCLLSLTTNGVLATPERLGRLVAAGLDILQISLNSALPAEHDQEIGIAGSHDQVLDTIARARRLGLEVLINTVVTRELLHSSQLEAIAAIATRQRCFLSLVLPARVGGWSECEVGLTEADYDILQRRWLRRGYVTTDTETAYHRGFCPAGSEKIYVSPYGDLFPCPFIHQGAGNVREDDVLELWRRMAALKQPGCCNVEPASSGNPGR